MYTHCLVQFLCSCGVVVALFVLLVLGVFCYFLFGWFVLFMLFAGLFFHDIPIFLDASLGVIRVARSR